MRVLLTGADGLLGAAIGARLERRGDLTLLRGRRRGPADAGASELTFDLRDPAAARAALRAATPDVVIHAAGRTRGAPSELLADNALASANLVEAIGEIAPATRLMLLGSAAQYGLRTDATPWRETDPCLPQEPYGISKQAAESCAFAEGRRLGLSIASLRVFNVVAPSPNGATVFAQFLAQAAVGPTVRLGPLGAVRDFVALDDVARTVEAAIDRNVAGEVVNVCTGLGRSARDLIAPVAAALGVGVAEAAEGGEAGCSVGDPARCEARLGFRPSGDLDAVVRAAVAWVRGARDARSQA
jgi:GDP-4-dehydro-6-deoxy-D-mannose reductase